VAQLTHKVWMDRAVAEAKRAARRDEVPVGAVVVRGGEVIASAHNLRESEQDPTAHAELLALRQAAAVLGSWRLEGCTLYVTLEPCTMCAGAIVLARLPALVYAAADPKAGAVGSLFDVARDPRLNHEVDVTSGVMAEECAALLTTFFRAKRARARSQASRSVDTLAGESGGVA
jgi:tRNA(adenine34) deaminase